MVVTNDLKTEVRNFMASGSATYPKYMLFGSDTTSASIDDSTMSSVITAKTFTDTLTTVTRQVQYEAILASTEATGSDIAQIGLSNESSGTSGTVHLKENINPITKTNNFDIQVTSVLEIE